MSVPDFPQGRGSGFACACETRAHITIFLRPAVDANHLRAGNHHRARRQYQPRSLSICASLSNAPPLSSPSDPSALTLVQQLSNPYVRFPPYFVISYHVIPPNPIANDPNRLRVKQIHTSPPRSRRHRPIHPYIHYHYLTLQFHKPSPLPPFSLSLSSLSASVSIHMISNPPGTIIMTTNLLKMLSAPSSSFHPPLI
ncbi:unnamed protein product [Periconia digitata]|uniref:Uncharacterized protein n=1 Tax=Periconia digitata TaxID=1303443 RepID=A0A9W4US66_9PLEO|nr:unnamed protein product [Periconia digitata]